jgi:hypothetical protein
VDRRRIELLAKTLQEFPATLDSQPILNFIHHQNFIVPVATILFYVAIYLSAFSALALSSCLNPTIIALLSG